MAAQIDWTRVRGFAMDAGSRTYHTAILARSLQIPAIVGLHDATRRVHGRRAWSPSTAQSGELIVDPTPDRAARARRSVQAGSGANVDGARPGPARRRATACASASRRTSNCPTTSRWRAREGAEGIGLFRSEVLLGSGPADELTEDRQYEAYRQLVEGMAPHAGDDPHLRPRRKPHGRPARAMATMRGAERGAAAKPARACAASA